jgi:hypothetical protein
MDYVLQIFSYAIEGYKAYETKKFVEISRDKIFELLKILVVLYFMFRIIRG